MSNPALVHFCSAGFDNGKSRREVSGGDFGRSGDATSISRVRSAEHTCRPDEKISQQDEVASRMMTASVTVRSTALTEQDGGSTDSSREALFTSDTSTSLPAPT